jgi:hypothetical protein
VREIFLVEYDLLLKTGAGAAILLGPRDPDPAGGMHCLLPRNSLFERLPVGRDALVGASVDTDLRRKVRFEPAPELRMKCRVLEAVGEVHCGSFY